MWENYPVIKEELSAFEEYLKSKLSSRNEFLHLATNSVVLSGGKRLRPAFTIIAALHGDYRREVVFPAAASVEILHAATLIHDDIIDNAKTRRGQMTLSEKHSINLAVYTGDYLLTKSLRLLIETGLKPERLDIVAKAMSLLCEGEIEQYLGKYSIASTMNYLKRIMGKTGVLFSASLVLGARAAGLSDESTKFFARFGNSFGVAFQIRDDLLDILSNQKAEGKPVLNDLREGIATLPVILAAQRDENFRSMVNEFFDGKGDQEDLLKVLTSAGGVRESQRLMERYIQKCRLYLEKVPQTPFTGALTELVDWL
ncbi:MAG: polyprenyl synthetase family protein [Clostridia bacterium]|nr:polyprenyl synthetase family protein [Clostridia bacterium]